MKAPFHQYCKTSSAGTAVTMANRLLDSHCTAPMRASLPNVL